MDIQVGSEASIATPPAGYRTLFVNTDKGNMLYYKNSDGTFSPASDISSSGTEITQDWMEAVKCALSSGKINAAQFQDIMNTGIKYQSNITTDADGNVTATVTVGSRDTALTAIVVNSSTGAVSTGTPTYQIGVTFNPTNASNKGLTFVSSDPTKATVNATGLVTKVAVGTTIISVIPDADASKTQLVTITVS